MRSATVRRPASGITACLIALTAALACEAKPDADAAAKAEAPEAAPDAAATPGAPAAETAPEKPPAEVPADAAEACAKVIVVTHAEAEVDPDPDTEASATKAEAKTKAEALRAEVEGGADFVSVAERASEEVRSRKKRGGLGTYAKDKWPERYAGLEGPIWSTPIDGLTPVTEIPMGFAFAQRCAVDKVHTRHLLVRYAGAERAPEETTRNKEEARARAEEAHAKITAGADFAAVAGEYGEDGTAKIGGDLGEVGRGMFVTAYEDAAWALEPGQLAPVVESAFGFHVIKREP